MKYSLLWGTTQGSPSGTMVGAEKITLGENGVSHCHICDEEARTVVRMYIAWGN